MESFLIIGMGRFGQAVAEELIALGHDVVAIEQKETVGQQLADRVTHVVIGDAKEEAVLRAVGVRNFDCVVLGMTRVEDSIMITLALKELGAKYVVAKAGSRQHRTALERVGADRVVFPERDMGIRLAQSVSSKGMIDCIELSPEDTIAEMAVPRKWIGHSWTFEISTTSMSSRCARQATIRRCSSNRSRDGNSISRILFMSSESSGIHRG